MATALGRFFRGRDIYTITIQALALDSAGTLQVGDTPYTATLTLFADQLEYIGRAVTQEIGSVTSPYENNVVVENDDAIIVREIMRPSTGLNLLAKLWNTVLTVSAASAATEHCLVSIRFGATVTGQASNLLTFYGLMSDYRETIEKGKCTAELTIQIVDTVSPTTNPTYASSNVP